MRHCNVTSWLIGLVFLVGLLVLSLSVGYAIEVYKAKLMDFDGHRRLITLQIEGNVYSVKLHSLCPIARPDGTKGVLEDLKPGLNVRVWVDKVPPTTVYAISIVGQPPVVMRSASASYPKGTVPDKAPIRGYAVYPKDMAEAYYTAPTSEDWQEFLKRTEDGWVFNPMLAVYNPLMLSTLNYMGWSYDRKNGLYGYNYKDPNLPEYAYFMAIEDSLYAKSDAVDSTGAYLRWQNIPEYARANIPTANSSDVIASSSNHNPFSMLNSKGSAPIFAGNGALAFAGASAVQEFEVKVLGVDLSSRKLILEGQKDNFILTNNTNIFIKKHGTYRYTFITIDDLTRIALPAYGKLRGYYLSPGNFVVDQLVIYQP